MLTRASRRALSATAACVSLAPHGCAPCARRTTARWTSSTSPATAAAFSPDPTLATPAQTAELSAGVPPPQRFVRRWFLPGVDRPSTVPPGTGKRASTPAPHGKNHGEASAKTTEATEAASSSHSPSATTSTDGQAEPAAAVAATKSGTHTAVTSSRTEDADADADATLAENKVLKEGLHTRNAHIKALLVAGLGSSFARAGIHNDGIRTSFSAVNTQSIKQLTGLTRIPPKLMLSCMTNEQRSITWLDISAHPTATLTEYKESVQEIMIGLGMHQSMINDSAEPVLLPQVTVSKDMRCLLMRYATEAPMDNTQDTFQDLTNRFTLFMSTDMVVTVHRTQCTYVEELKVDWQRSIQGLETPTAVMGYLLFYFVKETLGTFSSAISRCIVEFDRYESGLFVNNKNRSNLAREIYHIKRRASVYSRTLKLTQDAFSHMAAALHVDVTNVQYQEVQHSLSHVESTAEELNANADSVLQLLFQLSSYQVNELMRVLTLFSAFFIPLSFISSAYGMNFENLPLLHTPHGELYCGGLMMFVGTVIYFWFKSKHFI